MVIVYYFHSLLNTVVIQRNKNDVDRDVTETT